MISEAPAKTRITRAYSIKTTDGLRKVRGIGCISDLIFDKELDYTADYEPGLQTRLTSTSLLVQLQWTLAHSGVRVVSLQP